MKKQLNAIEERRKHALLEVAEGSEDEKLINAKYDEEINELLKSSKELLPVWHVLFNEITDAGIRKLKDILKSANTLRENAVKFKDDLSGEYKYKLTFDNGKEITLTQKEYEKFLEQIESTQDKLAKREPI